MTLAFNVERDSLRHAVDLVAKVASTRNGIMATGGIRLTTEGDKLHLAATDLDTSVTTTISVGGATDGVVVVPAKRLSGAVAALPEGAVAFTANETDKTVSLRRGTARFSLPTYAAEEFPRIDSPTGGQAIDGAAFRAALAAVLPAASKDQNRAYLTGVYLHADADGRLVLVATDSYRLHKVVIDAEWEGAGAIVPPTALAQLAKLDAASVIVSRLDYGVAFAAGETLYTTRLIEGEYPNYPQLITTPATRFEVDRDELSEIVKRVDFAIDQASAIRLAFTADRLRVHGKAEDGSTSSDEMAVEWSGPDLEVGVRPGFLAQALDMVGTQRVEVRLTDANKPMYLRPVPDDGTTVAGVMPIRVA